MTFSCSIVEYQEGQKKPWVLTSDASKDNAAGFAPHPTGMYSFAEPDYKPSYRKIGKHEKIGDGILKNHWYERFAISCRYSTMIYPKTEFWLSTPYIGNTASSEAGYSAWSWPRAGRAPWEKECELLGQWESMFWCYYRGLTSYLFRGRGPYYKYSIMGPRPTY